MHGGKEGAVEPSSTLGDEFRNLVGNVGFGIGGFYIVQDPLSTAFRDEFPAEDLEGRSL